MKVLRLLAAAIVAAPLALGISASSSSAGGLYPDFVFDAANSKIEFQNVLGRCIWGSCSPSGHFDNGAGYVFSPMSKSDHENVEDMITWKVNTTGKALGGEIVTVKATLAFSEPDPAEGSVGGLGGYGTIFGKATVGGVIWENHGIGHVTFHQGSVIGFDLENVFGLGKGNTVMSDVKFFAKELAPVPLPAAGWLLLAGVGGLAAMKRRKKA